MLPVQRWYLKNIFSEDETGISVLTYQKVLTLILDMGDTFASFVCFYCSFCSGYSMPHLPASSALQRFRVVDLTQVRAGPTACRQLADWGADVIQVQMPEHMRGDDTLGGQEGSDYQYTHRNKRSITLNLKEEEGISVLKRLIGGADVVVENFRPDVKFRLGIDYETLRRQPAPGVRQHLRLWPVGPPGRPPRF